MKTNQHYPELENWNHSSEPKMKAIKLPLVWIGCILLAFRASATTHYVDLNSTNPVPPYTSWGTAATNIQDAIDATSAEDLVLVTNGVYQTGGRVVHGTTTNRAAIDKPITVRSINGPNLTIIRGNGGGSGNTAVRCVYLTNEAVLVGFTLTRGGTAYDSGGGVWCESTNSTLNNCVLANNVAYNYGGGAYGGTLNNCVINSNSASAGGGTYSSTLNNCVMSGNLAYQVGAACFGSLNNCTLSGNSATYLYGGAYSCTLLNCVSYYNSAPGSANYTSDCILNFCCTTPLPTSGLGNISAAPRLTSNLHLQDNSPCINAGNNAYVFGGTDLDGRPRVVGGTVDMGAYENQKPFNAWLAQYSLPTDGSADFIDSDGDGMNNWQEYTAGTVPTNAASVLQLASPSNSVSGMTVTWQSVSGITYFLQSSTNLSAQPAFSSIQSNIIGQAGTTSYTDTTATNGGPYFYRVGVQ